jgi:hypothetical protein
MAESKQASLKPSNSKLATTFNKVGLVNNVTSVCQDETILKKITYFASNNTI